MKKRILLLFTVALAMAAMMMAMGAQAFAFHTPDLPPGPPGLTGAGNIRGGSDILGSGTNATIVVHNKSGGASCVFHFEEEDPGSEDPLTLNKLTGAGC